MVIAAAVAGPAEAALVAQLDASSLALSNGDPVTTWGGQTAAGTPTYLTGQTPGGGPAVEFNGGGDRMGSNVSLAASAAQDWIVAAVIRPTSIGAYHNLIDDDASNRPMLWIDPLFSYELNFSGGTGAKGAGAGPGGWDIVIADSRLNQLYVNSPTPNATGRDPISFGASEPFDFLHRDGGQTYRGLVAELRVYNDRADFGGDFAALYNELNAKWLAPDTDGDGVPDGDDLCPGTAMGDPVDANGCSDAQVDADGDGFCAPGAPSGGPDDCTLSPEDCDDNDPDVFPGNPELCDGKDNDCNGTADDGLTGGSASCVDVTQVLCYNRSTRRRVTLTAPGPDWDCAAGGLALAPGQRLTQYIYGTAQATCTPVGGAVCGVTPTYLQCLNLDNGTRGYPPVAGGWDCEAAGLVVSDGQRVRMTADGTVD